MLTLFLSLIALTAMGMFWFSRKREDYEFLTVDSETGDLTIVDASSGLVALSGGGLQTTGRFHVNGKLSTDGTINEVTVTQGGVNGVTIGNGAVNGVTIGSDKVNNVTLMDNKVVAERLTGDVYYVGNNPLLNIQLHWRQANNAYNEHMDHAYAAHSVGSVGTSSPNEQLYQIYKHPTNWAVHSVTWHPERYEAANVSGSMNVRVVKFSNISKVDTFMNNTDNGKDVGGFVWSTDSTGARSIDSLLNGKNIDGNTVNITGITGGDFSLTANVKSPPVTLTFTPPLEVSAGEYVMLFSKYSGNIASFPEFGYTMHGYQRP